MKFRYTVTPSDFADADQMAAETLSLFQNRPGFYTNSINSHLRGKLGEFAATAALRSVGLEPTCLWTDLARLSEADLDVPGRFRADVKTWDRRYWQGMGRCVAVGQFQKLKQKAEVIIWCHTDSVLRSGMEIEVAGWSTMADVAVAPRRLTGPSGGRQVDNYQLDEGMLRSLDSLLFFSECDPRTG